MNQLIGFHGNVLRELPFSLCMGIVIDSFSDNFFAVGITKCCVVYYSVTSRQWAIGSVGPHSRRNAVRGNIAVQVSVFWKLASVQFTNYWIHTRDLILINDMQNFDAIDVSVSKLWFLMSFRNAAKMLKLILG